MDTLLTGVRPNSEDCGQHASGNDIRSHSVLLQYTRFLWQVSHTDGEASRLCGSDQSRSMGLSVLFASMDLIELGIFPRVSQKSSSSRG